MDTSSFDKFHYTGDEYVSAVANSVNLDLFTNNVFVNEYRLVLVNFNRGFQIVTKLFFCSDYLHSSAAENEARSDENGITDFGGGLYAVLNSGYCLALRLRNVKFFKYLFECISVFRSFDSVTVGADNFYSAFCKRLGEIDCSLTTEGSDNTFRLFHFDNVHNVLGCERLEIELVSRCIVGRNCFRVVIYDNCFVARLFDCCNGVNGRIVEFNALTDTDRTCAENDNLFLIRKDGIIFLPVCRIEVGDICICVAGVNHLIHRHNCVIFAEIEHCDFVNLPQLRNKLVAKSHFLCFFEGFDVERICFYHRFKVNDALNCFEEIGCDCGNFVKLLYAHSVAQKLCNGKDAVVTELLNIFDHFVIRHVIEFSHVEMAYTDFE